MVKLSTVVFLSVAFIEGYDNFAAASSIGSYEIKSVGAGVPTLPSGKITSLEPFAGIAYFETHPDRLISNGTVSVEIVGGVGGKSCYQGSVVNSTGTNFTLNSSSYAFPSYTTLYPNNEYPQTSNGVIGVAEFSFFNLFDLTGNNTLFYPKVGGPDGEGNVDFCVRLSHKLDISGDGVAEYVSLFDSRFNISVIRDTMADFDSSGDGAPPSMISVEINVDVNSSQPTRTELNATRVVDLDTFLCGTPGVNDGKPFHSSYRMGQNFQVCVTPQAKDVSTYAISSFESVICENQAESNVLVSKGNATSILTEILKNVTGSKGLGANEIAGSSAMGFSSVITPSYFNGNQNSFSCQGNVTLLLLSGGRRGRHLKARFVHKADDLPADIETPPRDKTLYSEERELQPLEEGRFAASIELSRGVNEMPFAAATLAYNGWISVVFWAVAAVAFAI